MAKKIVKKAKSKSPVKGKKAVKKSVAGKKSTGKKPAVKKTVKRKPISEKELEQRQANQIANTEKKKQPVRKKAGVTRAEGGKRPKKDATSKEVNSLLDAIVDGMQEKKAHNITVVNLSEIENRAFDYFVICDADSKTQVEAIAHSVEDVVSKKTGEKPYHAEGFQNAEWILIDYINIVAHVFQKETRDYYNVENLWADAEFKLID